MATTSKGVILDTVRKAATSLGYPQLKKEQEVAIVSFVSGNDVFVSLPTALCVCQNCLFLRIHKYDTGFTNTALGLYIRHWIYKSSAVYINPVQTQCSIYKSSVVYINLVPCL